MRRQGDGRHPEESEGILGPIHERGVRSATAVAIGDAGVAASIRVAVVIGGHAGWRSRERQRITGRIEEIAADDHHEDDGKAAEYDAAATRRHAATVPWKCCG